MAERMKILVILAHPKEGSLNHAIAQTVVQTVQNNGHEVIFHDLYKEKFDPILPKDDPLLKAVDITKDEIKDSTTRRHIDELSKADGIVVVHPNWWEMPPAILKGWLDRVIVPGIAFHYTEEGEEIGLLKAKAALVFNTSNTPEETELNVFGDPLENLWSKCILNLCGIKNFYRKMYKEVMLSTLEQRKMWLKDVADTVNKYFPASS